MRAPARHRRTSWLVAGVVVAGVLWVVVGAQRGSSRADDGPSVDRVAAAGWAPRGGSAAPAAGLSPTTCSLDFLVEQIGAARTDAYRAYVIGLFHDTAIDLPLAELLRLLAEEQRPHVLGAIASAVVGRYERTGDTSLLAAIIDRFGIDADPARRAALVRSLAGASEPASVILTRLNAPGYEDMIRDPAPEVRRAVVENLIDEGQRDSGRDRGVATSAVAAAVAADPATAASLLTTVSMQSAPPASVTQLHGLLRAQAPSLREAAATALGTVDAADAERTMAALAARFRAEPDARVKAAIMQAVVRVGFQRSIPLLKSFRGESAALDRELGLWLGALALRANEWPLILAEKRRLERVAS